LSFTSEREREGEIETEEGFLRRLRECKRKCYSLCLLLHLVTPFIERKGVPIVVALEKVIPFVGHDAPKVVL